MEVKLTKIHRSDKDKNGNPYIGKTGSPYTRLGIQTLEHGSVWLSGFGNQFNANRKVGDIVDIEVEKVKGKDGKEYLNFKTASVEDKILKEVNRQAAEIANLKARVSALEGNQRQQDEGRSKEEPDLTNLPF